MGTKLPNQKGITNDRLTSQDAAIRYASDVRPALQRRVTIDLDTASTDQSLYEVGFQANAFYVESATDSSTTVSMVMVSVEQAQTLNYTKLKLNDSGIFSQPVNNVYLKWAAQAGKSITIVFYIGVEFRPGSFLLSLTGGVTLTTGSGMTPVAAVTVTNAATALLIADTTRKKTTLQVLNGPGIYISGVNTVVGIAGGAGTTIGYFIPAGGSFEITGSGAYFGITDAGSSLVGINTES